MKKILLVEDDVGCLKSISTFLRGEGYEVAEAHDGEEALQLLTQGKFDLILSDIRMPGTDGIRLLERARVISNNIPVILMTAYANEIQHDAIHADDFISKPFILAQLLRKIPRAIESRGARN